ncbi:MAG TPA: hypothetical protein VMA73_28010 [Streptosporangiaceae bacterium]|nr:hypothetical protein [Streptosporangiaceae bacterium]
MTYSLEVELTCILGLVFRGPLVDLLRGMLVNARTGELEPTIECTEAGRAYQRVAPGGSPGGSRSLHVYAAARDTENARTCRDEECLAVPFLCVEPACLRRGLTGWFWVADWRCTSVLNRTALLALCGVAVVVVAAVRVVTMGRRAEGDLAKSWLYGVPGAWCRWVLCG